MPLVDSEIFTALKSYTSISTTDAGSLLRPTAHCDAFIIACHQQFRAQAEHFFQEAQICKRLVSCALETKYARQLAQEMCHPAVFSTIAAATYMRMELHRMCKNLVKGKTTKNDSALQDCGDEETKKPVSRHRPRARPARVTRSVKWLACARSWCYPSLSPDHSLAASATPPPAAATWPRGDER